MKFYNLLKFPILFYLFIVITSCQKEDSQTTPTPGPVTEVPKLKRVEQDANNYLTLDYSGTLVSKLKLVEGGQTTALTIHYNSNKKPATADLNDYQLRFIYKSGQLDKIEYMDSVSAPTVVEGYVQYSFINSKPAQATYYSNQGSSYIPGWKTVYAYYNNGDIKSTTDSMAAGFTNNFTFISRLEYEYDTKINPFVAPVEISYAMQLNYTPHNISKQTEYDGNNQVKETKSYVYQYNNNKVPVKAVETTTTSGQPATIKNIVYTY